MNLLLQSMLEAHQRPTAMQIGILADALESLATCEQVCTACVDASLAEEAVENLRACILHNLDCAAVCRATAGLLLRHTEATVTVLHAQLHACVLACQACSDACAIHGEHHEHCAICGETCRRCQEKCNVVLGEISPAGIVTAQ